MNLDEHWRRGPRETTPSKTNTLSNTKRSNDKPEIDHIGDEAAGKAGEEGM
jgi:hypothetical protein